ncbi:MAG: EutN/CcmL family microcompartment protein [Blastocatellia bacterium]|nr:EutN/CcmL family microcompartment protein [Blastocatellia bacterium]
MRLAKVIGNVVATIKDPELVGAKLLIIQPLDANMKTVGKPMVSIDSVGAGAGELVFWCRGKESSFPFSPAEVPTDCTITGIVDRVNIELELEKR